MKLIIETDDKSNVTKHVNVSNRGMQILLDLFAWIDMLEPRRLTMRAPDLPGTTDKEDDTSEKNGLKACNHDFVARPPHGFYFCRFCNAPVTVLLHSS